MAKFKEIVKEKKEIEVPKKVLLKSYITGIVFSVVIILPLVLFLVNLLIFQRYITYIQVGFFISFDLFVLLFLIFKDKALEVYINDFKNINLFHIRVVTYLIYLFVSIIIGILYFTVFRWW